MTSTSKASPDPGTPVPTPYPYPDTPVFVPNTSGSAVTLPEGLPLHACMGLNSCAGSDRYGLEGPTNGQGPNACAGQGYCATTQDHTCHVQNNCANQGGCGLYGTGEEMNHPGMNECRSLGSCATPINAERFSTNGPNKGKSVWLRAREVFEKEVWPSLQPELKERQSNGEIPTTQSLPAALGEVPAAFQDTGPTYLWISQDNKKRSDMTACGASGMSGAGGCG